jgi:hypothetical protein
MRRNLLLVVLLLCSGIQEALGAEALKKVRIASKAAGGVSRSLCDPAAAGVLPGRGNGR